MGAVIVALTTACIGVSVITFARRYVGTGSVYSYMPHVFGAWARLLVGAALAIGFVALIAGVLLLTGIFAGSFLVAIGLESGLSAGVIAATSAGAIAIAAALAYRGLDASVRTAVVLTLLTVPIIALITLAIAMHTGLHLGAQLSLEGSSLSGIFQGVAAGFGVCRSLRKLRRPCCRDQSAEAQHSPRGDEHSGRSRRRLPGGHDPAGARPGAATPTRSTRVCPPPPPWRNKPSSVTSS